jgi:hypothetical protein
VRIQGRRAALLSQMDCRRLLGILAVVVGAWLVSLPAVLLAMVAATVFVAILPRFQFITLPLLVGWLGIVVAAIIGSLAWGNGSLAGRVGTGCSRDSLSYRRPQFLPYFGGTLLGIVARLPNKRLELTPPVVVELLL